MSASPLTLSVLVLLAFFVAAAVFLVAAKLLSRDPVLEPWLVALALTGVSTLLLLALEDRAVMLARTPFLLHAGFAALVTVWYLLRRTTHALGPPVPHTIGPRVLAAMLVVPAIGVLFALLALVEILVLWAPYVAVVQASAVGAAWLAHEWRAADRPAPMVARVAPPASIDVFICYRRDDSADVTGRMYDRLAARFGRDHVFKDVDSIPLGVDFRVHLQEMVGRCDVLVVVMGDRWLSARGTSGRRLDEDVDFVRIEIETALERRIPVVPVLVSGGRIPAERELPPTLAPLAYRQGITVRPDPDFHRDMDRLIEGLERPERSAGFSGPS
jgi:hypothetical protein